jgi:hypothetical protein
MNYQVIDVMTEFYPNSEKAFLQAPLFGDAFKKNYFDVVKGRACDVLVTLDRLVVNVNADSLENAESITEIQYISEREMLARQHAGQYDDLVDLGEPSRIVKTDIGQKLDSILGLDGCGEGYVVLEQHCYIDLPGMEDPSGVPLPYIVTIEEESREILAIRRNWHELGNRFEKREWFTQYGFVPGFGFYHLGYIHLLGNFQNTLTAIMRSLVDAGSFSNMQGGFKSKSMKVLDDGSAVSPGEFRDVEFYGADLSKGIYPFQFKEPSGTLLNLLQFIEGRGQSYADSSEQVVADSTNYGPVGTTMALLDASAKFFTSIFKRFHAAQKKQLKLIAELNFENLPDNPTGISFNLPGEEVRISKQDYDSRIDIIPVSDPNISSKSYRLTLASQKLQAAQMSPDLHNMREAHKQYYMALDDDDSWKLLLPEQEQAVPREPMEDIIAAGAGQPIKAFPDQDNEAHISVKMAFINDPSIAQNPLFAAAIPALQANIREHMTIRFGQQLEGGMSLGLDVKKAAEEIASFNKFKAENPQGLQDPKQILAQSEMKKQENEALKIMDKKEEVMMSHAVDVAKVHAEVRAQDLDMEKAGLKAKNDAEKTHIEASLKQQQLFQPPMVKKPDTPPG